MIQDEEQKNGEQQPEEPEAAAEETPAEDQPPAEEALAEDAAGEDDSQAEEAAAPAEGTPAETAEETPAETGEETPTEQRPAGSQGKKEDVVPGAELDPIAIEPERELDAEERARREADEEERLRRERELIGDVDEDAPVAAAPAKLEGDASYAATGKRKSSVARVILRQ